VVEFVLAEIALYITSTSLPDVGPLTEPETENPLEPISKTLLGASLEPDTIILFCVVLPLVVTCCKVWLVPGAYEAVSACKA